MKNVRILTIFLILIITTFLIYYFRFIQRDEIIFTHFVYLPIIITAFWWQFKVVYVVLYISAALLFADYYNHDNGIIIHELASASFFMLVGLTIAYLTRDRKKISYLLRYRYIISSMQEPVAIIGREHELIMCNDRFKDVFPLCADENNSFKNIIRDQANYTLFLDSVDKCFKGENVTFSSYVNTSSSSPDFYEINFYPLIEKDFVNDVVVTFWDMTEFNNSLMRQSIASERQRIAINVLELLNRENTDADIIKDILELVKNSTGVEVLGMILKLNGSFKLYGISGAKESFTEYINSSCPLINSTANCPVNTCLCGHLIESVKTENSGIADSEDVFWSNNINEMTSGHEYIFCGCAEAGNYKSCAVIPLKYKNEITGLFILFDSACDFFNTEIINFYKGIVQSVGIALSRIKYESNLKKIIADKEQLIREVHHRVKNNMQVITSLISLQTAKQNDDYVRNILTDCQNRVRTMALVHEKMYSSNNFSSINFQSYIQSLVPILQSSYRIDRSKIKIEMNVSDVTLSLGVAIPLAQLINEILSNSFKHAFSDGRSGEVKIAINQTNEGGGAYCLRISDSGMGFASGVSFPVSGNLGFQLIDALIKQLRGRYILNVENGIMFNIFFNDAV